MRLHPVDWREDIVMRCWHSLIVSAWVCFIGACTPQPDDGSTQAGDSTCLDPKPLTHPVTGDLTGFVRCADGFIHRETAVPVALPEAGEMSTCEWGTGPCQTAADCTEGSPERPGRCLQGDGVCLVPECDCVYGCAKDDDCGEGMACVGDEFTGDIPRCVPAGCRDASDCGGGLCGLSRDTIGPGVGAFPNLPTIELACMSAASNCRMDNCEERTRDSQPSCFSVGDNRPLRCVATDGTWHCTDEDCDACVASERPAPFKGEQRDFSGPTAPVPGSLRNSRTRPSYADLAQTAKAPGSGSPRCDHP